MSSSGRAASLPASSPVLAGDAAPAAVAAADICPHLHLHDDPSTTAAYLHDQHACFKAPQPSRVAPRVQERFCLGGRFDRCPVYTGEVARPPRPPLRLRRPDPRQLAISVVFAVLVPAVLGAVFALLAGNDAPSGAAVADVARPPATAGGLAEQAAAPPADEPAAPPVARTPLERLLRWDAIEERSVQSGDTLLGLAAAYDTTVEAIRQLNVLPDDAIAEGQVLRIPVGFTDELTPVVVAAPVSADDSSTADVSAAESTEPGAFSAPQIVSASEAVATLRGWPDVVTYVVESGDSLLAIAFEYRTSAEAVAVFNDLGGRALEVDQSLRIPVGYGFDFTGAEGDVIDDPLAVLQNWPVLEDHEVGGGDAISALAVEYGTTPEAIAAYNGLDGDTIIAGQTLRIPVNFQLSLAGVVPEIVSEPVVAAPGDDTAVDGPPIDDSAIDTESDATVPDDAADPELLETLLVLEAWPDVTVYRTQDGDSLFTISLEFATTVEAIAVRNGLDPAAPLQVGVDLEVPVGFDLPLTAS